MPRQRTREGQAERDGDKNEEGAQAHPDNSQSGRTQSASGPPMGHVTTKSHIQSVYLMTKGAPQPEEAPEVYYRFTARTLERHGGVPLHSSYHKANVTMDERGYWRADLVGPTFGTIEVFSKIKLGDTTVYSQYNFLHFLTEEDAAGLEPEPTVLMPSEWPVFIFPTSNYNDMPFRGTQTENEVDFNVTRYGSSVVAQNAYIVDVKEGQRGPQDIVLDLEKSKYSLSPDDDPTLAVSNGPMGGMGGSKNMVAILSFPNNEVITFTFSVSRSKWSYRKLGLGFLFVGSVAVVVGIVTADRRRRFKYNECN
ncbi:MAG: hypothetical protein LBE38_06200 [Deltaproteobacteria bacterium]|nr:hypothetical protein [Deltaproteobacteria bacterium]